MRAYLIPWSNAKQAVYIGVNKHSNSLMLFGGGAKNADGGDPKKTTWREAWEETGGLYNGKTSNYLAWHSDDTKKIYVFTEEYTFHLGHDIKVGSQECSAIIKLPAGDFRVMGQHAANEVEFAKDLVQYVNKNKHVVHLMYHGTIDKPIKGSDFTSEEGWETRTALYKFASTLVPVSHF